MAMKLESVVPFGRSLDEYIQMFALTENDLQKSILGVGDGPASFNAEGTQRGYRIQSIDPLYAFTAAEIKSRFDAVVNNIIQQIKDSPDDWVWTYHRSVEQLRRSRERSTKLFCADYEQGKAEGRYAIAELPNLKYGDSEYDLGLCSHFLFLYSDQLDEQFHLEGICEMLRVCKEVRIFPLLTLSLKPSQHLGAIVQKLETKGHKCNIQTVPYELQRGGNKMLRVTN
ncbi:SAM-dependent methyltransferase [Phormidesmis priestleyi]